MIIIDNPSLIETFIDKPLTPSDWFEVTQEKIDEFAKSTGDFQWIHVDIEKAKKRCPMEKQLLMVTLWYHYYLFYQLKHQK